MRKSDGEHKNDKSCAVDKAKKMLKILQCVSTNVATSAKKML